MAAAASTLARGGGRHSSTHDVNTDAFESLLPSSIGAARYYRQQYGAVKLAQRHVGIIINMLLLSELIVWALCSSGAAAQDVGSVSKVPSWTTVLDLGLRAVPLETPDSLMPVQSVTGLVSPSWASSSELGYGLGVVMPVSSNTSTISCTMGIYDNQRAVSELKWAWQPVPEQIVATACDLVFYSGGPLRFYVNLTMPAALAGTTSTPYASWSPLTNDSSSSSFGTDDDDIHALALTDSGILLILDSANRSLWQSGPALNNSSALLPCPSQICSNDAGAAATPPSGGSGGGGSSSFLQPSSGNPRASTQPSLNQYNLALLVLSTAFFI